MKRRTSHFSSGRRLVMGLISLAVACTACKPRFSPSELPSQVNCRISGFINRDASVFETVKKSYVLHNIKQGVSQNDLEFKEYSRQLDRVLSQHGFAPVVNPEDAANVILVDYGIGKPRVFQYTYSDPVFQYIPGFSAASAVVAVGSNGSGVCAASAVTVPGRYAYAGQSTHTGIVVTFDRYLIVEAIKASTIRPDSVPISLWKTTIHSSDSCGDLRRIMPVMMAALELALGWDTKEILDISLPVNDYRARWISEKSPVQDPLKLVSGGYTSYRIESPPDPTAGTEEAVAAVRRTAQQYGLYFPDCHSLPSGYRNLRLTPEEYLNVIPGRLLVVRVTWSLGMRNSLELVLSDAETGAEIAAGREAALVTHDIDRMAHIAWRRAMKDYLSRMGLKPD